MSTIKLASPAPPKKRSGLGSRWKLSHSEQPTSPGARFAAGTAGLQPGGPTSESVLARYSPGTIDSVIPLPHPFCSFVEPHFLIHALVPAIRAFEGPGWEYLI